MNTVSGSPSSDIIFGSGDADLLDGLAGDDTIYPGDGDDQILGGEGADEIQYSSGNDKMQGGPGNDRYFVNDAGDSVIEFPNEGDQDQITTLLNSYVLPLQVEILYLEGAAKTASGNLQNNRIIGLGTAGTTIFGEAGDDFISGGLGACQLFGNAGNDVLTAQNDLLSDLLHGGDGNDELIGTRASDRLIGGLGNDVLFGFSIGKVSENADSTDDRMTGIDTATGDAGADIFDLNGRLAAVATPPYPIGYLGNGHLIITDFNRTEGDKIRVDLQAATYTLSVVRNDTHIKIGGDLVAVVQGATGLAIAKDFVSSAVSLQAPFGL
jgi:Ca2+-binding RTX toxin-like protein